MNPIKILWQQAVGHAERLLHGADQAIVGDPAPCVFDHQGTEPGVLIDFGREVHGALQLVTTTYEPKRPVRVRVRFGESASEAMGVADQDHAVHCQELLVPWCGSVEVGPTGFRFARIDLIEPGTKLLLTGARARLREVTTPRQGSFQCSDRRVQAVYETAARTVELCMQDYLWDGIKRDRLVWMGDLHPEVMVVHALHGAHPVVPKSLDLMRDTTARGAWMNGISTYSLWWIITQHDWYQRTGDRLYLTQQRDCLEELLGRLSSQAVPVGLLDWSATQPAQQAAGTAILHGLALQLGANLAVELGLKPLATKARRSAMQVLAAVPEGACKQVAALAVRAGILDPKLANRTILAKQPDQGLSTFYGYYVLEARAAAGDITGGLALLRNYWGGMLDLGATSFWEHYEPEWAQDAPIDRLPTKGRDVHATRGAHCFVGWRHSLCHGWAGGPAAWLPERVLGVTPAAPGYAEVRIAPDLGDLRWAEGVIPTPHGPISVRVKRGSEPQITLPPGVVRV